jgi:phosphoglycolate phosphatase
VADATSRRDDERAEDDAGTMDRSGFRPMIAPSAIRCNLCGSTSFGQMRNRPMVRCNGCRSLERTRLLFLFLTRERPDMKGLKVLHFAPEISLARALSARGAALDLCDLFPEVFPDLAVRRFDLAADLGTLPDGGYDLVIHSHVLEHIPSDPVATVNTLTRKLAPGGLQAFCVPIVRGYYREDTSPALSAEERVQRFGQGDHLRVFGQRDFRVRFLDAIPGATVHNPADLADPDTLRTLSIPEPTWTVLTGNTVISVDAAR